MAARAAFLAWSISRNVEYRDLSTTVMYVREDSAIVEMQASLRERPSSDWQQVSLEVPVQMKDDGRWRLPTTASIGRLLQASRAATAVSDERASAEPTPTHIVDDPPPTEIVATFRPELPPPPDGTVIYESEWSSGLDGWIGTPDWKVSGGKLVNDGSRASRDPWIEAPVRVDPWQSMVIEAQIDVLAGEFGSFGIVSRAGTAGWFQFGVRWDAGEGETGSPMAIIGLTVREQTMLAEREVHAEPRPLPPGAHIFRAEFSDGIASFFVDGHQVGQIPEDDFAPGEFIGLWSERTPLEVHFFRVTLV